MTYTAQPETNILAAVALTLAFACSSGPLFVTVAGSPAVGPLVGVAAAVMLLFVACASVRDRRGAKTWGSRR